MNLLLHLLSPAILGTVAVFLAILWMLKDETDKTRPVLVFALVLNLFYGYLLTVVLGSEDGLVPWKYDYVLHALDQSVGFPTAPIAASLQSGWRIPLYVVYQLMVPMMIVWFLATRSKARRAALVIAYVAELVVGPILYAILPACGPAYLYGKQWLHPPDLQAHLIRFSGMPNAFPSLHLATAFVFVLFAEGKVWRPISLLFLAATALATIATGEHYGVDLLPGLAFGCFAMSAGHKRASKSAAYLCLVLLWSAAIRFTYPTLIAHPTLLAILAAFTLAVAAWTLVLEWRMLQVDPLPDATPLEA